MGVDAILCFQLATLLLAVPGTDRIVDIEATVDELTSCVNKRLTSLFNDTKSNYHVDNLLLNHALIRHNNLFTMRRNYTNIFVTLIRTKNKTNCLSQIFNLPPSDETYALKLCESYFTLRDSDEPKLSLFNSNAVFLKDQEFLDDEICRRKFITNMMLLANDIHLHKYKCRISYESVDDCINSFDRVNLKSLQGIINCSNIFNKSNKRKLPEWDKPFSESCERTKQYKAAQVVKTIKEMSPSTETDKEVYLVVEKILEQVKRCGNNDSSAITGNKYKYYLSYFITNFSIQLDIGDINGINLNNNHLYNDNLVPTIDSIRRRFSKNHQRKICKHIEFTMLHKGHEPDGPEWRGSILSIVNEVITSQPTWQGLRPRNVKRWYSKYLEKRGRQRFRREYKASNDPNIVKFEGAIWQKLLYIILDGDKMKLLANITVSYSVIKMAALEIQKSEDFSGIAKIQALKFSAKWVFNFLKRQNFSRRKLTSKDKATFPSDELINMHMEKGQKLFQQLQDDHGVELELSDVFNWDETGWTTTMSIEFCFAPKGISRVKAIPGGRDRDRITVIPLMNGKGELFPLFIVIKDSSVANKDRTKDTDAQRNQLNMTVLEKWHKDKNGFTEKDGWEKKEYKKELIVNKSGAKKEYKIWYLENKETHHVICSQGNAYMDGLRTCLYLDVLLRGVQRRREKEKRHLFFWVDNVGSHITVDVLNNLISSVDNDYSKYVDDYGNVLRKNNGDDVLMPNPKLLPNLNQATMAENTTAYVQPCDLLLNKLLKDCARQERDKQYYEEFQCWKKLMLHKEQNGHDTSKEKPFSVKQHDVKGSLKKLITYYDTKIKLKEDVVKNTFIKGGLYPFNNDVGDEGKRIPLFLKFVKKQYIDPVDLPVIKKLSEIMQNELIDLSHVEETEVNEVNEEVLLRDEQEFDISDNIENMDDVVSDGETDDDVLPDGETDDDDED